MRRLVPGKHSIGQWHCEQPIGGVEQEAPRRIKSGEPPRHIPSADYCGRLPTAVGGAKQPELAERFKAFALPPVNPAEGMAGQRFEQLRAVEVTWHGRHRTVPVDAT